MLALLTRLRNLLPARLWHHATDSRLALLAQMFAFGCTGFFGFILDTATVYALRHSLGLYGAGMVAYVVAATGNWALNRAWTFRGSHRDAAHVQWARFLFFNLGGLVLNRGTYVLLVTFWPLSAEHPVLAVAAGAVVGMGLNFVLSRRIIFRMD